MRINKWARTLFATLMISVCGVLGTAVPAAADAPVYVEMLWIRCQDDTGEWGSDEIWVDVNLVPAGIFEDFDATETKYFTDDGYANNRVHVMEGDQVYVGVWEKDQSPPPAPYPGGPPSDWDFQGSFVIPRSLVDTGEHEGYAFQDGEYIVRFRVTSYYP